ncbi:MAG TPA: hypothetical protein VM031_04865 [Phycisphaerae bacterium]|nr:hypothetical protein [Phycisphaerae bacterium]
MTTTRLRNVALWSLVGLVAFGQIGPAAAKAPAAPTTSTAPALPTRVARVGDSITYGAGIRDSVIHTKLIPILRRAAKEKEAVVIDLYTPFRGKKELFPDRIHPNAKGAALMAREVYRALTGREYEAPGRPESGKP